MAMTGYRTDIYVRSGTPDDVTFKTERSSDRNGGVVVTVTFKSDDSALKLYLSSAQAYLLMQALVNEMSDEPTE